MLSVRAANTTIEPTEMTAPKFSLGRKERMLAPTQNLVQVILQQKYSGNYSASEEEEWDLSPQESVLGHWSIGSRRARSKLWRISSSSTRR